MRILVTGSNGFIGRNLIAELQNRGYSEIFQCTRGTTEEELDKYTLECEFVFHLAGVNRTEREKDFKIGNVEFTEKLLRNLKKNKNKSPIVVTSSIQADKDNLYGRSKKEAEDLLLHYEKSIGVKVYIYRLPNIFGKWSKPNYNSVISTFCYNIARNLEIKINDSDKELELAYIDDVLEEFLNVLEKNKNKKGGYCFLPTTYKVRVGTIAETIYNFSRSRVDLFIPNMGNGFTKKLYSTYLSYLPEDKFSYRLKMVTDSRGSFTEFLKFPERGQVSINISKPGIVKGNHWHHTKNEKFLVVSGRGVIRFRKIGTEKVIEYKVNGKILEVVDIPTGYAHCIINTGDIDMVTIMWANECYDPENADTYHLEV